jgi:Uma2 family endonuclease
LEINCGYKGGNPMAILTEAAALPLSYEAYMAEPTVQGRYEIINGVRQFMAGASYRHQRVANNISRAFYSYEQASGMGTTVSAPFDVLIRRTPRVQTRQPDVLFISSRRLIQGGGIPERGPLGAAPELVVEIISDSETQRILEDKLADYLSIGVDECWVVRPDTQTVEVLRLTAGAALNLATYDAAQAVMSRVFPGLTVSVADIFVA